MPWIRNVNPNHPRLCVLSQLSRYLVEGPEGAVLHTGDVRAEPVMLEQLARNPLIQKYIPDPFSRYTAPTKEDSPLRTLEAIYIDTAALVQASEVPSKEDASCNLVELMELFPDTTKFFINAWTWGYEDVLKAVARNFSSKVVYILLIVCTTKGPIDTRQPLQV